jgi:hypothetical protein
MQVLVRMPITMTLRTPCFLSWRSSLTESEKDATSGDQQASDTISDSDFSRGG